MTKQQKKIYDQQYRAAHRKEKTEYAAGYRAAHLKELDEHNTEYHATHRAETAWHNMHQRAENNNGKCPAYANVKVCRRWSGPKGQANFITDMGQPPVGTSLSRFGDVGDYKPSNCAWHTLAQQRAEAEQKNKYRGITWHRLAKKWMSQIEVEGKNIYLGLFVSKEEAKATYDSALCSAIQLCQRAA
jgi:hypothetical protein